MLLEWDHCDSVEAMSDWYELPDELIEVGAKVRVFYGAGSPHNELRHIRAVVDNDYIAYRVWKYRRWNYRIEWAYAFYLAWRDGNLKRA